MTNTITNYNLISTKLAVWTKATAAKPAVAADVKSYLDRVGNIKSIDDFLKDDRVYTFAMKAFGLGDMAYAKAFMRKVLSEGVDSSSAFANKLSDGRYAEFAATFNFKRYGDATTIFDRTRQGTVDRYVRQTLEETAGEQNANVRLALYFQRKAPSITSPFQILADSALTQVVYTALGLPSTTSVMDIDKQAALISKRVNFADFKSPQTLAKFITRFAAQADIGTSTPASSPVSLLSGASSGFSTDVLLAVQSIRSGSRN